MNFAGRVGEGIGETDDSLRAGAGRKAEESRRPEGDNVAPAEGARRSREEPDRPA